MAERTCILSGKTLPRERLIRFVAGPDGFAVADLAEKLPGRGAWIEGDADARAAAPTARAFFSAGSAPACVTSKTISSGSPR